MRYRRTPEEKKLLGENTCKWKDIIKMYLAKFCERVDWIQLSEYKVQGQPFVNMIINLRIPQKIGNNLTGEVSVTVGS